MARNAQALPRSSQAVIVLLLLTAAVVMLLLIFRILSGLTFLVGSLIPGLLLLFLGLFLNYRSRAKTR